LSGAGSGVLSMRKEIPAFWPLEWACQKLCVTCVRPALLKKE
jgi:hypothetical protein